MPEAPSATSATTIVNEGYPRGWQWEVDGDELVGTFVEIGEAPTASGYRPIVILEVAGERRTLWLFHEALRSKFAQEVARRPEGDLRPGEPVLVRRLGEKQSAYGRTYVDYRVVFAESPRRSPRDILGLDDGDAAGTSVAGEAPEGVPF